MHDFTEGCDPSKPLLIESPMGYLDNNSLTFDKDENITDYYIFYDGESVSEKDYQLVFEINMRESKLLEMDIVPTCFPGIIANKKVVNILKETCQTDFQIFPVTIKRKSCKEKSKEFVNHDYFLIHIIKKMESIDLEASEFLLVDDGKPKNPDNIIGLKKLRFKPCMQGRYVARDTIFPSLFLVSLNMFYMFHKAGISGAEFMPDFLCHYERSNYPELFVRQDND